MTRASDDDASRNLMDFSGTGGTTFVCSDSIPVESEFITKISFNLRVVSFAGQN